MSPTEKIGWGPPQVEKPKPMSPQQQQADSLELIARSLAQIVVLMEKMYDRG